MLVRSLSSTPKKASWSMKLSGSPVAREPISFSILLSVLNSPSCVRLQPKTQIFFAYGALSPEPSPLPLLTGILKCLTFRTYALMIITTHPDRLASAKRWVLDGLSHGRLKPVIAKIFPFGQMAEAHHFMESNEQIGKIVVTVP